jgi:hypothetical protein
MRNRMTGKQAVRRAAHSEAGMVARLTMRLLAQSRYRIPAHGWVRSSLWALLPDRLRGNRSPVYAIGMEGLGSRCLYRIGTDREQAEHIFALMMEYTVVPCALRDTLEELVEDFPYGGSES